jgi:hypothetical protein
VQVLLSLAKELKPHVWLNVHSGMFALFTPYDHKGHVPNTTGNEQLCWGTTEPAAVKVHSQSAFNVDAANAACIVLTSDSL